MNKEEIADNLLWPIWRGIDAGYKQRYARSIWQQFEDNIRSAAYTSKLATFYDKLGKRLGLNIRSDDLASVQQVIGSGEDRGILKSLRDETTYLTLLVRLKNEERKAEYKDKQEELF